MSLRSRFEICLAIILIVGLVATPRANAQVDAPMRDLLKEWNKLGPDEIRKQAAEGLPEGARPEILTWERAYALALVKHRSKRTTLAPTLDVKALEEDAKRFEVADFAKFRQDFLSQSFVDPSARFLALLAEKQAVENSLISLGLAENLTMLFLELIQGETSGLKQIDIEDAHQSVQNCRIKLVETIAKFRNHFDEFKVELGLSPEATVVLDRDESKPFRERFLRFVQWFDDPNRELSTLDLLIEELPKFHQVDIGDGKTYEFSSFPALSEELVLASSRLAKRNRGQVDPQVELLIRRHARTLATLFTAYAVDRRKLAFILEKRDHSFEQLITPPQPGSGGLPRMDLIDSATNLREVENRLVETWAAAQSLRLELYRDLAVLPAQDWKSFYSTLRAPRGLIPPLREDPKPAERPAAFPGGDRPPVSPGR